MKHRVVIALLGGLLVGPPPALAGSGPPPASLAAPAGTAAPARTAEAAASAGLPRDVRERLAAAVAAHQAGDWGAAAQGLAEVGPGAAPIQEYALYLQADSLARAGDIAGARAAAELAVERAGDGPLLPAALLLAARAMSSAGDAAGAARLYRRFVERFPNHAASAAARFALGQSLEATGAGLEAIGIYRALWLDAPATREAERAAERQRALAETGLAAPPPAPRERLERAERLLAAGQWAPARSEAEALLAESPVVDIALPAWRVVMESARRSGRADDALRAADRAIALAPAERRAPWLMERARLVQGRTPEQALAALDRVVREHPRGPDAPAALLLRAQILERGGGPGATAGAYQRVVAEFPDADEAGAALWQLGWIAWFRGALPEAAQHWTRLAATRAGQRLRDAAGYWAGRAQAGRGDAAVAARLWREVVAAAPRGYYGMLATARLARVAAAVPSTVAAGPAAGRGPAPALPAEPLEPVRDDPRYVKATALRSVGLADWADGELADLARRAAGDALRLYAVSAAFGEEARYHLALRILRRDFFAAARAGHELLPRRFWELFYPIGWRTELTGAATRAGLDPFFVAAVVREESSYDPRARSRVGARGLMQLMPDTARPLARQQGLAFREGELLDDPGANLDLGTAFIGQLVREFGEPQLAVAAYNAGPRRAREWWAARRSDDVEVWVEQIPFNETRAFVKRVMLAWSEYRRLYGSSP